MDDPLNPTMRRIKLADLEPALAAQETPTTTNSLPTLKLAPEASPCSLCDGAGYYKEELPYWHPNFGKLYPCVCKLNEQAARRAAIATARLGDELGDLHNKTFDNFDRKRNFAALTWQGRVFSIATQRGILLIALDKCQAYADAPRSWLYLYGSVGSGKSHLAAAIAHLRASRGEQVRYRSAPGLIDALKAGFKHQTSDEIFDDLLGCDLLVIDDFGAEHLTDWSQERFFRLLNERQGKPTILTSNLELASLAPDDDLRAARIADRIAGQAACICLSVSSYRRLPKA